MQRTKVAEAILKKNKARRLPLPDVKTHYKAIIIKIVQYWHKETDQWSRILWSPKIKPHMYSQFIKRVTLQ